MHSDDQLHTQPSQAPSQAMHERLHWLEQLVASQQDEIALIRERLAQRAISESPDGAAKDEPTSRRRVHFTSRRALLRAGGIGVAASAAVVVASATAGVQVAHAAGGAGDGTSVVQGAANINTSSTGTVLNPVASSSPAALLTSDNSSSASTDASNASGLTALGPAQTNGVIATANGSGGYGVWGLSDAGFGIVGQTSTGIDIGAGGTGRLHQSLQVFVGAPTLGSYLAGEQLRDSTGELWICTVGGSPGTWRKVAAPQAGFLGGAVNLLSAPIRIFDTRVGEPAPLPVTKGLLAGGSTTTIQVTGTGVGGVSVPAGAKAVIGNLTVVQPQGGGDLILYPHGTSRPLASNINYAPGIFAIANFAIVGLGPNGNMDLYVHVSGTNALFDVAGFVM